MELQSAQRRIALFITLLVILTIAANWSASYVGTSPVASLVVMWSPGIAALIASLLTRHSLKEIGWRPWPVKWLTLGWVLPILYAVPAYELVWLTGLGSIPSPTFLERARLTLGMPNGADWQVILSAFGYITLVNLLPSMVLSLGEEIGWSGFLVPELSKWVGLRSAGLISGVIWAAWHLPGILSGSYRSTGTPLAYQLACFTALVITTAILMAWLRMKSGSIWPVAILHATHNGLIQAFLDRITIDNGLTHYFTGEFGIAMLPFLVALTWVIWRRNQDSENIRLSRQPKTL